MVENRNLVLRAHHHQLVHSFQAKHSSGAFCNCVRLLQLWLVNNYFSGQQWLSIIMTMMTITVMVCVRALSGHMSIEAIELIACSVFSGERAPSTAVAGFIRCLKRCVMVTMMMMSEHDEQYGEHDVDNEIFVCQNC